MSVWKYEQECRSSGIDPSSFVELEGVCWGVIVGATWGAATECYGGIRTVVAAEVIPPWVP